MKKNIAVVMGGRSEEHSISVETGVSVVCALDQEKYNILPIRIERDSKWTIFPQYQEVIPRAVYKKLMDNNHLESKSQTITEALTTLKEFNADFMFIALHGQYGEDGSIQGLCEQLGLAHNGSGILASALGMDKIKSSKAFESAGLKVPRQIELPRFFVITNKKEFQDLHERIDRWFGYPCLIKPRFGGSSLGTSIANNKDDLKKAINDARELTNDILIQEFIRGREFTVGVLDTDNRPIALPPTEIISPFDFFDFQSKYNDGAVEMTPAKIPPTQVKNLQDIALKAHEILGCTGYSRTDIIVKDDDVEDSYFILETNTLPGLTPKSVYPAQTNAQGIGISELLDKLINHGLGRLETK